MRDNDLAARPRCRFRTTTDSNHDRPVVSDIVARRFDPERPNQVWATDIPFFWTQEGWMYLAVVTEHMRTDLESTALGMAVGNRLPKGDLLHHSDRGSQYASFAYQKLLEQNSITVSMSRRTECYGNAVVESFFGTLKTELIYRSTWTSRDSVRSAIHEYIELFYNSRRRHSRLGYVCPAEFEDKFSAAPAT